jgi:hypothetical protein
LPGRCDGITGHDLSVAREQWRAVDFGLLAHLTQRGGVVGLLWVGAVVGAVVGVVARSESDCDLADNRAGGDWAPETAITGYCAVVTHYEIAMGWDPVGSIQSRR